MKKTFTIIIILLFIITGGWLILKAVQETKFLNEEKPRIEKYLKYNYENIETVTFTEVKIHPTGVPHIIGYVNGDESTYFDAGIYNKHFEGDISTSNISMTDDNFDNGAKNVSDIEKEEAEKKNDE